MKITKKQLREMIREAVQEQLKEDYAPGKYKAPHEISGKYAQVILKKLGLHNDPKARMAVINIMDTAVNDAWSSGGE